MRAFEIAYERWLTEHKKRRTGERLRRLVENHGYGEKQLVKEIWWPAFGNFDNLHPEYEVRDFEGGYRYLDLAFIRSMLRVDLEYDGFGPHWQNITRPEFSRNLMRQNILIIDCFKVLRFSHDDIKNKPRQCQQMVQQLIGKYMNVENKQTLDPYEKEIIRVALGNDGVISLLQTCRHLAISDKTAAKKLAGLVAKGILQVDSGIVRISKYRLTANAFELYL